MLLHQLYMLLAPISAKKKKIGDLMQKLLHITMIAKLMAHPVYRVGSLCNTYWVILIELQPVQKKVCLHSDIYQVVLSSSIIE